MTTEAHPTPVVVEPELRLRCWRAYQNIVEIEHTRDLYAGRSDQGPIQAAVNAYTSALAAAPTPPAVEAEELAGIIADLRNMTVDVTKGIVPDPDSIADRLSRLPVAAGGGEDRAEVLRRLGVEGRKPSIGQHEAIHSATLKATIAALDAAGQTREADVLVWLAWHRAIDHNREEFLLKDWSDRYAILQSDLDAAREREAGLRALLTRALPYIVPRSSWSDTAKSDADALRSNIEAALSDQPVTEEG